MNAALFWDLDGTLLTTGRAGVFALEAALSDVAGVEHDLQQLVTSGLTDAEVAAAALEAAGLDSDEERVVAFLRAYEAHLPECLHRRRGHVMPGVRDLLEDLEGHDDVRSFLLTGNTPAGARAKLAHYELDRFFPDGAGAFCLGPGRRVEIAHRAAALADGAATRYVIGDTPQDIGCGKAIGARTIAVATGSYGADDLRRHDPWLVLDRIPDPAAFEELIVA
ncbi:MAG TPA: haloacid dehalogenase-like hydrolase [Gaiellaceae bacterium]